MRVGDGIAGDEENQQLERLEEEGFMWSKVFERVLA